MTLMSGDKTWLSVQFNLTVSDGVDLSSSSTTNCKMDFFVDLAVGTMLEEHLKTCCSIKGKV